MFNFDTAIDAYQDFNKRVIEKALLTDEVKKTLIDGVEIQTVLVKSWFVQAEKTYKTLFAKTAKA